MKVVVVDVNEAKSISVKAESRADSSDSEDEPQAGQKENWEGLELRPER